MANAIKGQKTPWCELQILIVFNQGVGVIWSKGIEGGLSCINLV